MKESGKYTFFSQSDDGSKVLLNGEVVVDNDGSHSSQLKKIKLTFQKAIIPLKFGILKTLRDKRFKFKLMVQGFPSKYSPTSFSGKESPQTQLFQY
nr:PA14 domain-containing protein [Cyclobacterium qasimii]